MLRRMDLRFEIILKDLLFSKKYLMLELGNICDGIFSIRDPIGIRKTMFLISDTPDLSGISLSNPSPYIS